MRPLVTFLLLGTLLFSEFLHGDENGGNSDQEEVAKIVGLERDQWNVRNSQFKTTEYKGKKALMLEGKFALAYLKNTDFQNGTIEVDMASPKGGMMFFGVAFRIQDQEAKDIKVQDNDKQKYEYVYFRPFRSGSQNAIQYCAAGTKFNWSYLRKNHPGVYEARAELPLTDWFHVKIVVEGTSAEIYVNDAKKPNLVVKDLKHGDSRGSVGVYSYWKTAYFANLMVTRKE